MNLLMIFFNISNKEWKPPLYSFLYFFFLMTSYFILRPVRDEMGIQAGIEHMQWLFTGTFIVMLLVVPLFGLLVQKIPRKQLIPGIYLFFSANIFIFYLAFDFLKPNVVAVIFFIWLSVFNLFVISIFWSFNSDIFTPEQAKKLFGPIAAGGSTGAVLGPAVTTLLAGKIGIMNLLLISAGLLFISTLFIRQLLKGSRKETKKILSKPMKGTIWAGLKLIKESVLLRQISLFILLFTTISTFLYFQQGYIISENILSSDERTEYFGMRDLLVNVSTLIIQFFLTEKILKKWGVMIGITILPLISIVGFFFLAWSPTVYALLTFQVAYRSLNFSLQRPSREILFTSVGDEERYKSKNFIDTAVYRGGDALSGWLFAGLAATISSLPLISVIVLPIAAVWGVSGLRIGKLFNAKNQMSNESTTQLIEARSS